MTHEPAPPDVPSIPGFRVLSLLGRGGGGSVYLAVQEDLQRQVAIKMMSTEPMADPASRRRMAREARTLAQISHPNLVRVYGHDVEGPAPFLVLEYCPRGTLGDLLRGRGAGDRVEGLAPDEVARMAREVLGALEALHAHGLVHRDVKPSNILFRETGESVLADLGIVRSQAPDATRLTGTGCLVGTIAYLPPEAYRMEGAGPRTDLFALGVTLFEALTGLHPTGRLPFPARFRPPDPRAHRSACPLPLRRLVRALMAGAPEDRPATARAALSMLEPGAAADAQDPPAAPGAALPGARAATAPGRRAVAAGAVVAAAATIAVVLVSPWVRSPAPPAHLQVLASSTGARIVDPGRSGAELGVADSHGNMIRRLSTTEAGGTTYAVSGLEPGTLYEAILTDGRGRTADRRRFSTIPQVSVRGALALPTGPQLWLAARPEATARAQGGRWIVVPPEGAHLSLGAGGAIGTSADRTVELRFSSGQRSTLRVGGWPGTGGRPRGDRPGTAQASGLQPWRAHLGIILPCERSTTIEAGGGGGQLLEEWVVGEGIGWLGCTVDPGGHSRVSHELLAAVARAGGVRTVVFVKLDPDAVGFVPSLRRELARHGSLAKDGPLVAVLAPPVWNSPDGVPAPRPMLLQRFQDRMGGQVLRRTPASERIVLVASLPGTPMLEPMLDFVERLGPPRAILLPIGSDSLAGWSGSADVLRRALGAGVSGVEFVVAGWMFPKPRDISTERILRENIAQDPLSLLRTYFLSRIFFPEAVCLLPWGRLLDPHGRQPGPGWRLVDAASRTLAGLRARGPSLLTGTRGRVLEAAARVGAFAFEGAGRRVHVLITDRAHVRARFQPPAPGVLTRLTDGRSASSDSRVVLATAPLEIALDGMPMLFEEVRPVTAVAGGPDPIDLAVAR